KWSTGSTSGTKAPGWLTFAIACRSWGWSTGWAMFRARRSSARWCRASRTVLRDSLKTLFGIGSMHALPALLVVDDDLMRLMCLNAQQVGQGVCQRGAAHRQGPRTTGPICPDALADNIVKLNVRDLAALFNRVIRALAQAGVLAVKVTGIVEATDLETTPQYE